MDSVEGQSDAPMNPWTTQSVASGGISGHQVEIRWTVALVSAIHWNGTQSTEVTLWSLNVNRDSAMAARTVLTCGGLVPAMAPRAWTRLTYNTTLPVSGLVQISGNEFACRIGTKKAEPHTQVHPSPSEIRDQLARFSEPGRRRALPPPFRPNDHLRSFVVGRL